MRGLRIRVGPCGYVLVVSQLVCTALAAAQATSPPPAVRAVHELHSLPGSALTIRGSTTIGASWHCTSTDVVAVVSVADRSDDHAAPLPDVRVVTIRVPVSGLHCQSSAMEHAMTHALKADIDSAARVISGRFEAHDGSLPDAAGALPLSGTLRVAGVDGTVLLRSEISTAADGSMSVHSELPLSLTTFGITPPRLLFGTVRVRNAVTIEVELKYAAPVVAGRP